MTLSVLKKSLTRVVYPCRCRRTQPVSHCRAYSSLGRLMHVLFFFIIYSGSVRAPSFSSRRERWRRTRARRRLLPSSTSRLGWPTSGSPSCLSKCISCRPSTLGLQYGFLFIYNARAMIMDSWMYVCDMCHATPLFSVLVFLQISGMYDMSDD